MNDLKIKTSHAIDLISQLGPQGGNNTRQTTATGGRHFVDIIGDISWTKGVTSRGHFWRHFVDKNVHEMSSFWVTFRGYFLDDISWTFFG